MILLENTTSFGFVLPLILLLTLMGLELGVALIQTYVFVTLICLYLNEGEVLHTPPSKILDTAPSKSTGSRILNSKIVTQSFPLIWYETLITGSIPKVLGISAGFQLAVFGWYYCFLVIFI